jgi:hypothetical protein
MSKPWFRMYHEFVSDPKVQLLAFEDQRHFIALLCLKCNDTLDSAAPSPNFRDRMIAKALGLSPDAALEAKRRLMEVGLIGADWHPVKWDARQYESDSSAERTRAYRDRKKAASPVTDAERHSDVTVTDKNRTDTEQSRTEQTAREAGSVSRETRPPDFETRLQATYPRGPAVSGSSWGVGIRNACRAVDDGLATADELLDAVGRYAASIESRVALEGERARQFVKSPAKFFDLNARPPVWRDEFPLAVSKAQAAQDDNVAAGLRWLQEGRA